MPFLNYSLRNFDDCFICCRPSSFFIEKKMATEMDATSGTMVLFAAMESDSDLPKGNLILVPLKTVFLYSTVGDYPEFEPKRLNMQVVELNQIEVFNSIASQVIHIAIDPLDYSEQFLKLVKKKCVNAKRLTVDANFLELANEEYKKKMLHGGINAAKMLCRKALVFMKEFDQIEELYFGHNLKLIEAIYGANGWMFERRSNQNAKFYNARFSTELVINLNPNLKLIHITNVETDPYDLRDVGMRCPVAINAMPSSQPAQLEKLEGGPSHICLNGLTNLRALAISYFAFCFHSNTVDELILNSLPGDYKVHQMFANLKKLRVKVFCPFVLDMADTGNSGLYDGVAIDELEIEQQIPCFCDDKSNTDLSDDSIQLQVLMFQMFRHFKTNSGTQCICTDVESIGLFKTLKIIKLRCLDHTVVRFIRKLHQNGNKAKFIFYEKSRFEGKRGHNSLRQNLDKLANIVNVIPHDQIEIVMKTVTGAELKKIEFQLARYVPEQVKITFTD